jgi:hypothetical protein
LSSVQRGTHVFGSHWQWDWAQRKGLVVMKAHPLRRPTIDAKTLTLSFMSKVRLRRRVREPGYDLSWLGGCDQTSIRVGLGLR